MEDIPLITFGAGEPVLCRIPDFARVSKIPQQTLYSAVSSGRIIHVRQRGKLYMDKASAEAFAAAYRKLNPIPEEES